jgi:hypothetical protein
MTATKATLSGEPLTFTTGTQRRSSGQKMARDWFCDAFVERFAATRKWEERESTGISAELARHFEII